MSDVKHGVEVYPHVAQWAAEMAAKPRTDEHIADAVATVARLSPDELAAFAKLLGNDGRNAVRNEFLEVIF